MAGMHPAEQARRLAAEALASNDPTGWFERLYAAAAGGEVAVPWDSGKPFRMLVEWAEARELDGRGRRALVVGCGLGQDAEYVARLGFDTVAFDIADTAIRLARSRFPDSRVRYLVADCLTRPPSGSRRSTWWWKAIPSKHSRTRSGGRPSPTWGRWSGRAGRSSCSRLCMTTQPTLTRGLPGR